MTSGERNFDLLNTKRATTQRLAPSEQLLDRRQQLIKRKWLLHVGARTSLKTGLYVRFVDARAEEHDWCLPRGAVGPDLIEHRQSVQLRHGYVEDDQVGRLAQGKAKRLSAVCSDSYVESGAAKSQFDEKPDVLIIFGDKDPGSFPERQRHACVGSTAALELDALSSGGVGTAPLTKMSRARWSGDAEARALPTLSFASPFRCQDA